MSILTLRECANEPFERPPSYEARLVAVGEELTSRVRTREDNRARSDELIIVRSVDSIDVVLPEKYPHDDRRTYKGKQINELYGASRAYDVKVGLGVVALVPSLVTKTDYLLWTPADMQRFSPGQLTGLAWSILQACREGRHDPTTR